MDTILPLSAFEPFPELETERLRLTRMDERFIDEKHALRTNPAVRTFLDQPLPSREEIAEKIRNGVRDMEAGKILLWAILRKADDHFLGDVGFWRMDAGNAVTEIGYALFPENWRKGYMRESLLMVLPYAFGPMRLHRVEANVNVDNRASANLLTSVGFQLEAHMRENFRYQDRFLDSHIYGLLETDLQPFIGDRC